MNKTKNIPRIADVVHGTIYLSELEKAIISTPIFNRLHYISQTSTVFMTFPSNNTKRFDHSIGTMKLCGDIFFYSITNADEETIKSFFSDIKKHIIELLDDWHQNEFPKVYIDAYGDENLANGFIDIETINIKNEIYNSFLPGNLPEKSEVYYTIMWQSIRIAGLLHDLGHPPFSHIVERGLELAVKQNVSSELTDTFSKVLNNNSTQLHEQSGNSMIKYIEQGVLNRNNNSTEEELKKTIFNIICLYLAKCILCEKDGFGLYKDMHRIISGALDGDRLDNATRDAIMTGLDNSKLEYQRIVNTIALCGDSKNGYLFCPNIKTLPSVEEFFLKRWKNYKNMTHHHRVIKTNFMLQMTIYHLCEQYEKEIDKHRFNRKEKLIYLPYDISGLWKPLKAISSNHANTIRLIQWNDNWLLTVLQKYFLDYFSLSDKNSRPLPVYYYLEELIESKKNYSTVVKRYEDYKLIDASLKKSFDNYLFKSAEQIKRATPKNVDIPSNDKIDVKSFVEEFNKLKDNWKQNDNGPGFYSSLLTDFFKTFQPRKLLFNEVASDIVEKLKKISKYNIEDCFIVAKDLKAGTDELLELFYVDNDGRYHSKPFKEISTIDREIKLELSVIPEMFIFIKFINNENVNNKICDEIKTEIGKIASLAIQDYLDKNYISRYFYI